LSTDIGPVSGWRRALRASGFSSASFFSSDWVRDPRVAAWILVAALGLNVALALPRLADPPLTYDESFTARVVEGPLGSLVQRVRINETTGPVYFFAVSVWTAVGGMEPGVLRSFSLLLGLATLVALWRLGAAIGLPGLGACAALLAATCPFLIWHEQSARFYTLVTCLAVLTTWLFVRMCAVPSVGRALAYGSLAGIGGQTFTLAYLLPLAHAAGVLLLPPSGSRPWRALLISGATVAVCALAQLPLMLHQLEIVSDFWIPERPWSKNLPLLYEFGGNYFLLLAATGGALLGLLRPRTRQERFFTLVCLLWMLAVPAALVARTALGQPSVMMRYVAPSFPAFVALGGSLVTRLPPVAAVACAGLALTNGLVWLESSHRDIENRVDLARSLEAIEQRVGEGDALLYTALYLYAPAMRMHPDVDAYLWDPDLRPKHRARFAPDRVLDHQNVKSFLAAHSRIWIVHYGDLPRWVPKRAPTRRVPPAGILLTEYRRPVE
jgi:hypothetical protein